jgi:hypothetical protein
VNRVVGGHGHYLRLASTTALILANGIWAVLVTIWAQSVEPRWFSNVIKPEYLHGAAGGATFAAATWLVISQRRCWMKIGLISILLLALATTYLGVDQLYRRYADWMFGISPLDFMILLSVTLAIAIPLMAVSKDTAAASNGDSLSPNSSLPGQFTIRQLLAWITLIAVYCAVLRLATRTDPFVPVTNTLTALSVVCIRRQLWFVSVGTWSILPFAWAITRRRRLSKQTWTFVVAATLVSIVTAFPLFSCLGRYLNGYWDNPQQLLLTALLLPFLIGFIATAIPNLIVLAKLGLLSPKMPE